MVKIRKLSEKEYSDFLIVKNNANFLQSLEEYKKLQSDNQNTEIIGFVGQEPPSDFEKLE